MLTLGPTEQNTLNQIKCTRVAKRKIENPEDTNYNARTIYEGTPNFSMRMTPMAAILVRHQLKQIDQKIEKFNRNWWNLYNNLNGYTTTIFSLGRKTRIEVAQRLSDEKMVGTSFLFNVMMIDDTKTKITTNQSTYEILEKFSNVLAMHGITNAWFGRKTFLGFTSTFKHWRYVCNNQRIPTEVDDSILSGTNTMLSTFFDIPLYHTSSWREEDFLNISEIIKWCLQNVYVIDH